MAKALDFTSVFDRDLGAVPILHLFDWRLLRILCVIILGFILAHVITGAIYPKIPLALNISHDGSLPEWMSYLMLFASSLMMVQYYRRSGALLALAFALLWALMLLDDSLQFHEIIGARLAAATGGVSLGGLDLKDSGELLAYLVMAAMALPPLIFGYVRTTKEDRPQFYGLAILAALLGFFSVGLDLVHSPICDHLSKGWYCFQLFDILEDGGEMLCEALIVSHTLAAFARRGR